MRVVLFYVILMLAIEQLGNCITGSVAVTLYINDYTKASVLPIAIYDLPHFFIMMYATLKFGIIGAAATTMIGIIGVNLYQYIYSYCRCII